jgi:putrescine:ornithine antiporter
VPTQTVSAQHLTGQPVPVNSLNKATLEVNA